MVSSRVETESKVIAVVPAKECLRDQSPESQPDHAASALPCPLSQLLSTWKAVMPVAARGA